jgi:hypothetical protein
MAPSLNFYWIFYEYTGIRFDASISSPKKAA